MLADREEPWLTPTSYASWLRGRSCTRWRTRDGRPPWTEGSAKGTPGRAPAISSTGSSGLIYREKERLKGELASMDTVAPPGASTPADDASEEMRFELAEMRGRLEAIEAALDSLARRLDAGSAGK